mgnify:CR=1 FL=1
MQDAKALASVIGEEELSQSDKQLMAFGRAFEQEFIGQGNTDRTMEQTLDLGWELLAALPAMRWIAAMPKRWINTTSLPRRESVKSNPQSLLPWGRRCPRRGG